MGKAKSCDRCGNLFTLYDEPPKYRVQRQVMSYKMKNLTLDLCPKCSAELQQWMEEYKAKIDYGLGQTFDPKC